MTTTATLSRGDESVSFPITNEAGAPLIARDFGKPNHNVEPTGTPNPRTGNDTQSGSETLTISTVLDSNETALNLADLIKAHSGGTPTTLSVPLGEFDNNIDVFPAAGQQQALSLEYEPGRQYISADLALTRVDSVQATDSEFRADTPRATGNGPVALVDGATVVEFSTDLTVERTVGRPNVDVRRRYTNYPKVTDQRKSSYDVFDLSLTSLSNATSTVTTIRDMFRKRRGRDTLTLDFNGLYNMGSFNVMPDGSQALRHVRLGGRKGSDDMSVPALTLRVVQ